IGNLQFGPEVGAGPERPDAPVIAPWLAGVATIADDLRRVRDRAAVPATIIAGDARRLPAELEPRSIDAVITSPPYPNEKDNPRATRLESVLIGFITNRADLRSVKQGLVRSNSHGVYSGDDDDRWAAGHAEIARLAGEIEVRRIALGKTSGFERL